MADIEEPKVDEGDVGLSDSEIIARRSADITEDKAKSDEFVKVFVLGPCGKPTEASGYDHEPNKAATRQFAIDQGMRPVGDVRLVSTKAHKGAENVWDLTYALPVAVDERLEYPSGPNIVSDGPTETPDAVTPAGEPTGQASD